MSKNHVEIDSKEVIKMLVGLDQKLRNQAYRNGIRYSLNIVKKETIKNLRARLGSASSRKKDKYGKNLEQGVKIMIYRDQKGGNVNLFGNYKTKWFEQGTGPRYNNQRKTRFLLLKKKRYTGQIKPLHFFYDAYTSKEREVFSTLEKNIANAIQKINNKEK